MVGALDSSMAQVAKDLIDDLGRNTVLTKYSEAYDEATSRTVTTKTTTDEVISPPIDVRFTNLLALDPSRSLIKAGDAVVYMATSGANERPDQGTTEERFSFDIDGIEWNVVNPAPIYSGEEIAALEIQIRRAGA